MRATLLMFLVACSSAAPESAALQTFADGGAESVTDASPTQPPFRLSCVSDLVPNTWTEAPNTALAPHQPKPGEFPNIWGGTGPASVYSTWNGAALDSSKSRIFAWGGGHGDYFGNEMYVYDIAACMWQRLTDPSPVPAGFPSVRTGIVGDMLTDGRPQVRHTYSNVLFLEHAGLYFTPNVSIGEPSNVTWTFDPGGKQWTAHRAGTTEIVPPRSTADFAVYNPKDKLVYYEFSEALEYTPKAPWGAKPVQGWWTYSVDLNKWTRIGDLAVQGYAVGLMDVARQRIVGLHYPWGKISTQKAVITTRSVGLDGKQVIQATIGGDELLTALKGEPETHNPGFDYDANIDRYVVILPNPLPNGNRDLWLLDPNTWQWSKRSLLGTGPKDVPNGYWSRFKYVPALRGFVALSNVNDNVWMFKLAPSP
jgi:hypothetical protein